MYIETKYTEEGAKMMGDYERFTELKHKTAKAGMATEKSKLVAEIANCNIQISWLNIFDPEHQIEGWEKERESVS